MRKLFLTLLLLLATAIPARPQSNMSGGASNGVPITPSTIAAPLVNSVVVLTPATAGAHWTDKLVTAYGTAQCASGCTIEIPDSVADNGAPTTPVVPSNVTIRFTGSATFQSCNITMGMMSKAENDGAAVVQLVGSGCTGFSYATQATLQTNDQPRLKNIIVDCNNQTNSTGVSFGGASTKLVTDHLSASNCTTVGLLLNGAQFTTHYATRLWNDTVGVKIYTIVTAGGGNSNTFYDMVATNGTVGVVMNDNGGTALRRDREPFRELQSHQQFRGQLRIQAALRAILVRRRRRDDGNDRPAPPR